MKSSKNHTDKSDSIPFLEKSMQSPKHFLHTMSTCVDSHFVLLVVSMGFVFYCITQEHTANVFVFHQTKVDSDSSIPDTTDSYTNRNNISIIFNPNKPQINIETETVRRLVSRQKRLSEKTTSVERVSYLCFKTDEHLRYCVNLTEDENQNIILSMKIIINTKNANVNISNTTDSVNTVDNGNGTNSSNDTLLVEELKNPMSVETFDNEEISFESTEQTHANINDTVPNNGTPNTPMLEPRKSDSPNLRMSIENFENSSTYIRIKDDPNAQNNDDRAEIHNDSDCNKSQGNNHVTQRVIIVNEPKLIYRDQKKLKLPLQARQPVYEISNLETLLENSKGRHGRFNKRIGNKQRTEVESKYHSKHDREETITYQPNYNPEERMHQPKFDTVQERKDQPRYETRKDRHKNKISREGEKTMFRYSKPRYFDQPDEDLERVWTGMEYRESLKPKHHEHSVKFIPRNQKDEVYNTNSMRHGNLQVNSRMQDDDDPDLETIINNARHQKLEAIDREDKKEIENVLKHINKYDRTNKVHAIDNSLLDVEELYEKDQILAFLKNGKKKTVMAKDIESEKHNENTDYDDCENLEDTLNASNDDEDEEEEEKEKEEDIKNIFYTNKQNYDVPGTLRDPINAPKVEKNNEFYNNKHKNEPNTKNENPITAKIQSEEETRSTVGKIIKHAHYQDRKFENEKLDTEKDSQDALIKQIVEEFKNNFIAKFTLNKAQHQLQVKPPLPINQPQFRTTTQRIRPAGRMELSEEVNEKTGTNEEIAHVNNNNQQLELEDKGPELKDDNQYDDEIPNEQIKKHNENTNDAEYDERIPNIVVDRARLEEKRPTDAPDDVKLPPGEYINLNQGYFQKSPKSWESLESVYHIRDNK
ncbi:hypothetical protein WDU94_003638 [Cyamophila willieti]